ncbi:MAG: type 4a pilus biogenesis protein PilO [Candidatus Aegiribacteria sp.]|nr:type 4a pilus biogenesis protein PilO [Candidatus Aegiribacteria sp.]MBD3294388.1 type 4a pilus biogenesis protein PilO [Candidatus Fermentibacteria bacterium]
MNAYLRDPRFYVLIVGIILVAALLYLYPKNISSDIKDRIEQAQQNLDMKQAELSSLQSGSPSDMAITEQEINRLNQQLAELDRYLPRSYDQDEVLDMLTENAENSGLQINSLTPLPPSTQGDYLVYGWQMHLTGRFHRLGVFLDQLTQQMMMTAVTDFTVIQRKASDGSYDNMEANFTVSAYVQP